ncbi:hypothetical protein C7M29_03900 [Bacillus subtilis]|nr:hypothetical protein C7M29_03900 [Bacillus subtilis]
MRVIDKLIKLHEEHTPSLLRLCRQAGWPDYGEQELALLVQQGRFFAIKMSAVILFPASACFCLAVLLLSAS